MESFVRIQGIAAPLLRPNIDTDLIIPSREITSPGREGYGEKLFAPWRYLGPERRENPDFVLNREPFRRAQILVAGANFGCGSSREMAVCGRCGSSASGSSSRRPSARSSAATA